MRKPNRLYRKLGGKRSTAGAAFAVVCHPVRTLKASFGWDRAAQDAAEGIQENNKSGYWKVQKILQKWGMAYRGPKLSSMFKMWSQQPKRMINAPKPELD